MRRILMTVAAALGIAGAARADSFHVATTGDDAAAGTSAAPWRTIQRAVRAVAPGDTVIVHAGSYVGFAVDVRGTEAGPIAFVADGAVAIDGAATTDRDAIHVEGASWVRIEGFTVTRATRAGISAIDCDHITLRGNRVDQNGKWGIFSAFCEDLVVENNEASRSGEQHGIYASNSADRPVIRHNRIWGNAMCGIHMNGDISQGGDGVISDAVVEDNVIFDNGRAGCSAINGDGVTRAVIRNNVLDGNHASGISLYQIDGGAPSTGNRVINNRAVAAAPAPAVAAAAPAIRSLTAPAGARPARRAHRPRCGSGSPRSCRFAAGAQVGTADEPRSPRVAVRHSAAYRAVRGGHATRTASRSGVEDDDVTGSSPVRARRQDLAPQDLAPCRRQRVESCCAA